MDSVTSNAGAEAETWLTQWREPTSDYIITQLILCTAFLPAVAVVIWSIKQFEGLSWNTSGQVAARKDYCG
jgi:hypothetical protein